MKKQPFPGEIRHTDNHLNSQCNKEDNQFSFSAPSMSRASVFNLKAVHLLPKAPP